MASELGLKATIVVPRSASAFKRAAIKRYGGEIVFCGKTQAARERALARVQAATGASYIPPYDHPAVIAGQGTAALEILRQAPQVEEIWTPVGGGGLVAGTVLAAGQHVQVVGAEPQLARDTYDSLRTGRRQPAMPPQTVADGLRAGLGELNFRILNAYRLPMRLVSDAEILAAQKLAMSCLKLLIEPSSAVPIAALLKYGAWRADTRTVVVILSGGNLQI